MCARRSSIAIVLSSAAAERRPAHHPQPERIVARRTREPREPWWCASTSCTTIRGSPSSAPRSTACSRSTSAPSLRQLVPRVCLSPAVSAALQIGDDVAAAERVDRLLRVADQDQRGAVAERAVDHLPLHRVGVLELVDHHDRPALMHPQLGRGVVGVQRVGQPGEQVVVAEDAPPPLAGFQFGQNVFREVDADRGAGVRFGVERPQLRRRVLDHLAGQPQRVVGRLSSGSSRSLAEVGEGRGRRRSRRPARRGSRPASRRRRCRLPPPAISAPAGRTGGWWRWSPRRKPPARPAAADAGRDASSAPQSSRCATTWLSPTSDGSSKATTASTIWRRTRSRSSWLAARPNVISSIWSSVAAPSATYRVTRAGQRERLAGAGAGLQHGGRLRGGQRAQQIEAVHHAVHRLAASAARVRPGVVRRGPASMRTVSHAPWPHARTCAGSSSSPG